jgi:hypothetical protein
MPAAGLLLMISSKISDKRLPCDFDKICSIY